MSFVGILENTSPGASGLAFLVQAAEVESEHFANLVEMVDVVLGSMDEFQRSEDDNNELVWPILSIAPLAITQIAPRDELELYLTTLKENLELHIQRYQQLKRSGRITILLHSAVEGDDEIPLNECIVGDE